MYCDKVLKGAGLAPRAKLDIREAAQMSSIYANAFLTIAATHAADGSKSLFSKSPSRYEAAPIPTLESTYFRREWIHPQYFGYDSQSIQGTDAPLLSRAWVFQERHLSPRTLHYLSAEVAWECNSATQCECIPAKINFESNDQYKPWNQIVAEYSGLALSYQKDKFPAIGGVARAFKGGNGKYIAGLWEDDIYNNLCWIVPDASRPRPSSWHAPTWSWASINDGILRAPPQNYSHASRGPLAFEVQESFVQPAGPDEFGELLAAHLVLSAHLLPARLHYGASFQNRGGHLIESPELHIDQIGTFPLTPDYLLNEPGDHYVPSGTEVFIMYFGDINEDDSGDDDSRGDISPGGHYMAIVRCLGSNTSTTY